MTGPAFTIEASQLRSVLNLVAPAVKAKSMFPIPGVVQLTATEDGTLTAWATDLEKGVVATAPAVVRAPGTIVVAHDLLAGLASRLAGPVACERVKDAQVVEAGSVTAKVRAYPDADHLPAVPIVGELAYTLPAAALLRAIERTAFAANRSDPGRQTLMGVFVGTRDDPSGVPRLRFAATDGFVLAVNGVDGVTTTPDTPPVLIPAKGMTDCLAKLLKGTAADVEVRMVRVGTDTPSAVTVVAPAWTFYSRLLEGTFPDYNRIIPAKVLTTVTVDAEDLAKAVRTALPFAHLTDARDRQPIVRFAVEDHTIRVRTTGPDRGELEVVGGCRMDGPAIDIAFNAHFVLDILGAVGEGAVEIGLNAPNQPVVFREGDGTWVVMPMVIPGWK